MSESESAAESTNELPKNLVGTVSAPSPSSIRWMISTTRLAAIEKSGVDPVFIDLSSRETADPSTRLRWTVGR